MFTVRLSALALSTVEIYADEDWTEDAPEIEAVCAAWRAGGRRARLLVDPATADLVRDGLVTLGNTEDEQAEGRNRHPDPEVRRIARGACSGLGASSGLLFDEARKNAARS